MAEEKLVVKPMLKEKFFMPILRAMPIEDTDIRTSFQKLLDQKITGREVLAAEVGVYEAVNARIMLSFCPNIRLYLVDDYENLVVYTGGKVQSKEFRDCIKNIAELNVAMYNGKKIWNMKKSTVAALDYPDNFFDYVYIDGDHLYEEVKKDIYAWYSKVRPGGILGGHDVNMVEVHTAVAEFIVERQLPNETWGMDLNKTPYSDWWIYKQGDK